MNWMAIGVGILFLICIIVGYVKGILRMGVSLVATIATIVLVMFISPYAAKMLHKWTPIDAMVETQCVKLFTPSITTEMLLGSDLSGTALADYNTDELAGLDLNNLDIDIDDVAGLLGAIPKDQQIKAIEASEVPDFLKSALLENNNSESYSKLGVSDFPGYIATFISDVIINILAFLITFILVTVIVRALIVAVDIVSDLPVLGFATRITGALAGAVTALVIVWIVFLILTPIYTTPIGTMCFKMIDANAFLSFLYSNNPILDALM